MADLVVGVDLGTSFTAAASSTGGQVEVVQLRHDGSITPSVAFVRPDRSVAVGEVAVRLGSRDPQGVVREFKRRFGDPMPFVIRGSAFTTEQLTADLLGGVLDRCRELYGQLPRSVALTHPAAWTPYQSGVLLGAADLANVGARALVTEPQAAALAYAHHRPIDVGASVAVFDLGGGTFDATVLRRDRSGFELLGEPVGIERLGGIDFDLLVLEHVRRSLDGAIEGLDTHDAAVQRGLVRLRSACVNAKEELSSEQETTIEVALPGIEAQVGLTREEFEAMIAPSLERTIEALRRALRSAAVEDEDLDVILLVGGSTRVPLVVNLLEDSFATPVAKDLHPKLAVAIGAVLSLDERSGLPSGQDRAGRSRRRSTAGRPRSALDGDGAAPAERAPRGPSRAVLAGTAVAVFALLVLAAALWSRQGDSPTEVAGSDDPEGPASTAITPATVFGGTLDRGDVWAASVGDPGILVELARSSGDLVTQVPFPKLAEEPVVTDEFVWTARRGPDPQSVTVDQTSRTTGSAIRSIPLPVSGLSAVASVELVADGDGLWALVIPGDAGAEAFRIGPDGTVIVSRQLDQPAIPNTEPVHDGSALFVVLPGGVARVGNDGRVAVRSVEGASSSGLAVEGAQLFIVRNDRVHILDSGFQLPAPSSTPYSRSGATGPLFSTTTEINIENAFLDGATLTFLASPSDGSDATHFFRVDAASGAIQTDVSLGGTLAAGSFDLRQSGPGVFWAYRHDAAPPTLLRLDGAGAIRRVMLEKRGDIDPDITVNGGAVVVSDVDPTGSPVVYVVDPDTARVVRRVPLG